MLRGVKKQLFQIFLDGKQNNELNYSSVKKSQLINQITWIFIFCSTPYFFIFRYIANNRLSNVVLLIIFSLLISIIFNKNNHRKIAATILIITANLTLFFYSSSLSGKSGIQLVFFANAIIPFVTFMKSETFEIYTCCLIPIGLYTYLELNDYHFFTQVNIDPNFYNFLYLTIIFVTFSILILSIRFYSFSTENLHKDVYQQNQFLNQKNKELIEAYKQLEDKKKLDIEFEIAQEQQEEFLPAEMPRIPGYTIQHYFKGARGVSGDFFDYRCFGRVVKFFVADVMSKSMSAAFVTVHLYSMFRTLITAKMSPSRLLNTMNRAFVEGRGSHEKAAAFAFELDTNTHTITYAHACIGIAISILNGEVKELEVSGMMAGADASVDYKMFRFQLAPGDMMIVASDGLEDFKMRDGKRFGHKRIMEEIQFYAANKVGIGVGFRDFMVKRFEDLCDLDALQADDVVLIVVQRD